MLASEIVIRHSQLVAIHALVHYLDFEALTAEAWQERGNN